jgi:hypothetical protein
MEDPKSLVEEFMLSSLVEFCRRYPTCDVESIGELRWGSLLLVAVPASALLKPPRGVEAARDILSRDAVEALEDESRALLEGCKSFMLEFKLLLKEARLGRLSCEVEALPREVEVKAVVEADAEVDDATAFSAFVAADFSFM